MAEKKDPPKKPDTADPKVMPAALKPRELGRGKKDSSTPSEK